MSDGIENNLTVLLIKNILSEIWGALDDQKNLKDLTTSSKHDELMHFINKTQVYDENSAVTKAKNPFISTALSHMEDEWDNFEDEHKESQLKMIYIIENKSFEENKVSEKEIKVTSRSTENLVKNSSFITSCTKQRPMVCYDYLFKTRSPSFKHVELLTPVKEKKWFEDYKIELQFLQEHFSEVLPKILYDVVRKRVTDPVHYIVYHLIKYKVDNI